MQKIARLKRRFLSHRRFSRLTIFLIILLPIIYFLLPIFRITKDFVTTPININKETLKSTNGRTNILLLGIGGGTHDGPLLTDTMIVASIPASPSAVTLISIPRDIYLDSLQNKINYAYVAGGLVSSKAVASEVTGLPIHYGIRIDFSAFQQIIDTLGGVDINVERTLDDYQYPIQDKIDDTCGFTPQDLESRIATSSADELYKSFPCRYEHLHFDPGPTHMNGSTALKFVRSRHAEGDEGTDFARSKRQELLITAIKNKVFSADTFLSPKKIELIYNIVKNNIDTDFNPSDSGDLLNLALKYKSASIKSLALDTNLLYNPPIDSRGWILIPRSGNWDEIHQFLKSQLQ